MAGRRMELRPQTRRRYFLVHGNPAPEAAQKASEVFLSRRLFKQRSNAKIIHPNFMMQHYPLYWHYDFLGGLKAMAEMDLTSDPRCSDALDLLERKELPRGGWAAEGKLYKVSPTLDTRT